MVTIVYIGLLQIIFEDLIVYLTAQSCMNCAFQVPSQGHEKLLSPVESHVMVEPGKTYDESGCKSDTKTD